MPDREQYRPEPGATHGVRPELLDQLVPIDSLRPYPGNARTHADAELRESLSEHGQFRAVAADPPGVLLYGHGTLQAARSLGWTHIAAITLHVGDEQARRMRLVDNRLHDLGGYDPGQVVAELMRLAQLDDGLLGTGYSDEAYADLLAANGQLPDLDDLADAVGDPTDDDGLVRVTFRVVPAVAADWKRLLKDTRRTDSMEAVERIIELARQALTP